MITPNKSMATENVNERFEKVSTDIFRYVKLGLIKPFDVTLYVKYLELFNEGYGYAFPTIHNLELFLNCSRQSIITANKRLVDAGLLRIRKHKNNNNIYFPLQPYSKQELAKKVPHLVIEYESRKEKLVSNANKDRERYDDIFNE